MIITRHGTERIVKWAFELARKRGGKKKVTCVDKANVVKSLAFWRRCFDDVASKYPDVEKDYVYIDAMSFMQVARPLQFDVVVTENMFGDIISDLGAGTVGGMGIPPSGDIGDQYGLFQPIHGTAPDIAGKGIANPAGQILSAAMMLDWIADKYNDKIAATAAELIEKATVAALQNSDYKTSDLGGKAKTTDFGDGVIKEIRKMFSLTVAATQTVKSSDKKKLRGVTVGAGFFSDIQMTDWKRIDGVEITAVCDIDVGKLKLFAEKFKIPNTYTDIKEMLEKEKPDFVDIVTRPNTHLDITKQAVQLGVKAILCQKPMAETPEEALDMVNICKEKQVRLMINENFRWRKWFREIKHLISQNIIGEPFYAYFCIRRGDGRGSSPYPNQPYFKDMKKYLLFEAVVHYVDVSRFLFGEIATIYSAHKKINKIIQGEDLTIVNMSMKSGVNVLIDANRYSEPLKSVGKPKAFGTLKLEGTLGQIELEIDGTIRITYHGGKSYVHSYYIPENVTYPGDSTYETQKHFVECLINNSQFETEGENYLNTFYAVFAGYQAADKGCAIDPRAISNSLK
eukprot:TRINITY_DN4136_c0_g1_i3.p1 TRINITY_DN4136_c0_g1~~TRINITY_DN4136_c0_g1_i3.p1  ORF type:complete len:569 (-),score=116.72 TRINITY_DN4136_c0_g1_i3:8-1714(-)